MKKILVPIENFSRFSLAASDFAVNFAKRNPSTILFLIFSRESPGAAPSPGEKLQKMWPRQFDRLIQRARAEKIQVELFFSGDEYLEAVSQFARDHHAREIIIGLPRVGDPAARKLIRDVDALRDRGDNQIVIVRPKEEPDPQDCTERGFPIPAAPVKKGWRQWP